jgi:hypothetical protein
MTARCNRRRRGVVVPGAALALLTLIGLLPVGAAQGRVPRGFFGVVPQAPLESADFDQLAGVGLCLRLPVRWYEVEPRQGEYDFSGLDALFAAAAAHRIRILPQLGGSPSWVASDPARAPLGAAGLAAWRGFTREMVSRYGPGGDFWNGREQREPVHAWQIWNEPNFVLFWRPHPSPRGYARLLHAGAQAIRGIDPGARIVAAGLAPIEHSPWPWEFLRRLYQVPGVKRDFDVAALHPYSPSLRGLEYEVRRTRRVMARAGDGAKPLLLTEVGVASGGQVPNPMDRGARGQALYLERTFSRLAAMRHRWRIAGAYWFSWQDAPAADPNCVFCQFAGLFDAHHDPKPAWQALRRTVLSLSAGGVR